MSEREAADEHEVITPEWLESVGFKKIPPTLMSDIYTIRDISGRLQVDAKYGRATWGDERLPHVKTRGDVRLLCLALNIALQPSGQEHPSRSIQRREAAMRGEEPPEFKPGTNEVIEPIAQEQADLGPQRGPSSVAKVEAESKAVKRRLAEIEGEQPSGQEGTR